MFKTKYQESTHTVIIFVKIIIKLTKIIIYTMSYKTTHILLYVNLFLKRILLSSSTLFYNIEISFNINK